MLEFTKWLNENKLSASLTAYHCGHDRNAFSLDYIGEGEGMQILGPGIYFATNPHTAIRYCKYATEPVLFEVILNTENLYGTALSFRLDMANNQRLDRQFNKIASKLGYESVDKMPTASTLRQGRYPMGQIVMEAGNRKAIDLFLEHGIDGAYEFLPHGDEDYGLEIAVWNLNAIRMKNKWPMQSQQAPEELGKPEPLFSQEYLQRLADGMNKRVEHFVN